jgi:hypothetical protein
MADASPEITHAGWCREKPLQVRLRLVTLLSAGVEKSATTVDVRLIVLGRELAVTKTRGKKGARRAHPKQTFIARTLFTGDWERDAVGVVERNCGKRPAKASTNCAWFETHGVATSAAVARSQNNSSRRASRQRGMALVTERAGSSETKTLEASRSG